MNINFSGFDESVLTFEHVGAINPGDPVKVSASAKVTKASANDDFCGICVNTRNGYAAVRMKGYVECKKSGTVTVGYKKLVAASEGVKVAESGIDRLVIYVDDTTVGFML